MFKLSPRNFMLVVLALLLVNGSILAGENRSKKVKKPKRDIKVTVLPWGRSEKEIAAAKLRAEQSPAVQAELNGRKYRLLEFSYLEDAKSGISQLPARFRVSFYDYTNDREEISTVVNP
jgi:hypothetical protein